MRSTTPHIGAEPSVGPKTVVVGFPRVVVECLLALTERARGGAAAVEGINFVQVGEAKASEAPRALHANGPPDAGLECLLGLGKAVGTHETPFARGRTDRTARYQHVHVVIHLAESANSQAKNGAILEQQFLDRALFAGIEAIQIWIVPTPREIRLGLVGQYFCSTLQCYGKREESNQNIFLVSVYNSSFRLTSNEQVLKSANPQP